MRFTELLRRGRVIESGRSMLGGHATAVSSCGTLVVTYTVAGSGDPSEIPLARRAALDALDIEVALFALEDSILSRELLRDAQSAAFTIAEEVPFRRLRAYALASDLAAAYPDPADLPDWFWDPPGTYSVRDLAPDAYALGRRAGAEGKPSGGFWAAYRERTAGRDAT